jgi:hypothetical protein
LYSIEVTFYNGYFSKYSYKKRVHSSTLSYVPPPKRNSEFRELIDNNCDCALTRKLINNNPEDLVGCLARIAPGILL